ncbi:glycosyltransferase family 4 protein [Patescibacteria group bacterium]|nr:glycosyltransferase family 4 protein [Patescibacteria group bacterium]MBU1931646.1 glycosyltransferase family 4 protein [Patescibacteria group bacterium]
MKIAIDCRFWGVEHTGLGRYTEHLLKNLLKQDKQNQYFLLVNSSAQERIKTALAPSKNFNLVEVNARHYSLKEQLVLPRILNQLQPDLTHFLHFNTPIFYFGKTIVTIHDLIKHYSRGRQTTTLSPLIYYFKYLNYRLVFGRTVKKAVKIIVPSEFVRLQLIKVYGLINQRVKVISEGVEPEFFKTTKAFKQTKPYLLYVGNLYPHKNLERLVQAIKLLQPPIELVIVSSRDVFLKKFIQQVDHLCVRKLVRFIHQPSDRQLRALYQGAAAFITPSLIEGFGLPGIEAMASGCLVLAAQASCLPEIYGKHACYFDPLDVNDIKAKIAQVRRYPPAVRKKLILKAKNWAKQYCWQKTAQETLSVYKK